MNDTNQTIAAVSGLALVAILLIIGTVITAANINVYTKELKGKAQLREAEWSRQIAVEEAKALKESATLRAEAEVERAKGVAQANAIISDSLKGNEEYLRYLWIDQLANGQAGQVIYVPTEAGLPILEAGKRQ
jgi:regulator of protease activity HflC (stomatin/prohibitin superfamily)